MAEAASFVIRNAQILDGAGADPKEADVAIRDGKIVCIGSVDGTGERDIDATGLVVSPGFIDIHTHADAKLLECPDAWNYISQGVTTVMGGNCGGGPLPVQDFADRCSETPIGINIGLLAGHINAYGHSRYP